MLVVFIGAGGKAQLWRGDEGQPFRQEVGGVGLGVGAGVITDGDAGANLLLGAVGGVGAVLIVLRVPDEGDIATQAGDEVAQGEVDGGASVPGDIRDLGVDLGGVVVADDLDSIGPAESGACGGVAILVDEADYVIQLHGIAGVQGIDGRAVVVQLEGHAVGRAAAPGLDEEAAVVGCHPGAPAAARRVAAGVPGGAAAQPHLQGVDIVGVRVGGGAGQADAGA